MPFENLTHFSALRNTKRFMRGIAGNILTKTTDFWHRKNCAKISCTGAREIAPSEGTGLARPVGGYERGAVYSENYEKLSAAPFLGGVKLLVFHLAKKFFERGLRDDSIELRSVIIDQADVLDDHVINFPIAV